MDMKNPFVINGLLGMVRAIPLIVPGKSRSRGSFCCALVVVCLLAGMIAKDAESQEPSFFNSVHQVARGLGPIFKGSVGECEVPVHVTGNACLQLR
jgi:hypothetical protein